jgi:hypothetical protein
MANLDERDWDLAEADEQLYQDGFGERIGETPELSDDPADETVLDTGDDDLTDVTADQTAGQRHVSDFRETLDGSDQMGDTNLMEEAETDNADANGNDPKHRSM